jgi:hypothetical protein
MMSGSRRFLDAPESEGAALEASGLELEAVEVAMIILLKDMYVSLAAEPGYEGRPRQQVGTSRFSSNSWTGAVEDVTLGKDRLSTTFRRISL